MVKAKLLLILPLHIRRDEMNFKTHYLIVFCIMILQLLSIGKGEQISYPCIEAKVPIKIDGKLEEWRECLQIRCVGVSQRRFLPEWKGPQDLSAVGRIMWDKKYFYTAWEIRDDVFAPSSNRKKPWEGDCIAVALYLPGAPKPDQLYVLTVFPSKGARVIYGHGSTDKVPLSKISIVKDSQRHIVCYEAAIPWSELGYIPKIGSNIRCNFLIMENDKKGVSCRSGWVIWTEGSVGAYRPGRFAKVYFVDKLPNNLVKLDLGIEDVEYLTNSGLKGTCYIQTSRAIGKCRLFLSAIQKQTIVSRKEKDVFLNKGMNQVTFNWPDARIPAGQTLVEAQIELPSGRKIKSQAEKLLVVNPEGLVNRINNLKSQVNQLAEISKTLRSAGLSNSYQRLYLRVADWFIPRIKDAYKAHKYEYAERVLKSIERYLKESKEQAKYILANPSLNMPVPDCDMSQLSIRNGNFYVETKPVLLIGPVTFLRSVKELKSAKLSELGFNAMEEVYVGPWWLKEDEKTLDENKLAELIARLDFAKEHNISYELLLSLHYVPKWFMEKYPDAYIKNRKNEFVPFILDHPATRKMVESYLKAIVSRVKDHPALACYSLLNEAAYWEFNDYTEKSIVKFRNWLRKKHKKIAILNKLWKTNYASFDDVLPPPRSTTDPYPRKKNNVSEGMWYDWLCSNDYRYSEFVRWAKSIIRQIDPDTPFMVETYPVSPRAGGTGETISVISDINCTDREDMYDFFRSVCPDKPVYDTEYHYDFSRWKSQRYFEYKTWCPFLHGCDGMLIWVWRDNQSMSITREPEKMVGFGKSALDLRRLSWLVQAFQNKPAKIAVYFSDPSWKLIDKFRERKYLKAISLVNTLNVKFDVITDRLIDEGKLSKYKLLIAYGTTYVSKDNFNHIVDFAKRGGKIVLIGRDCMSRDPYGCKYNLKILHHSRTTKWLTDLSDQQLKVVVKKLLKKWGLSNSVKLESVGGVDLSYVEMQTVKINDKLYVCLVNHSDTNSALVTIVNKGIAIIPQRELINGKSISGKVIKLNPLEVAIYEF